MKIVADENIPYVADGCAEWGEVSLFSGRTITRATVADADCLFVRSVTPVSRELLDGSSVRFVGTATIGTDHVDIPWLQSNGIGFASAPGSNATSVAEYVVAALLCLAVRHGFTLSGRTMGIVGVGNVGTRVTRKAEALGLRILKCDPPRADAEQATGFVPLEQILAESDIVSIHTPLTRDGAYPTWHMADSRFFHALRKGAIFINTARGAIHDTGALVQAIDEGRVSHAVLDVWEHEPGVEVDLLARVSLASPHVAGYSFDGKVAGTQLVVNAARQYFRLAGHWTPAELLPAPDVAKITVDAKTTASQEALIWNAVRQLHDSMVDDAAMRQILTLPLHDRPAHFDQLRKNYRIRREFAGTAILAQHLDEKSVAAFSKLGFRVHASERG